MPRPSAVALPLGVWITRALLPTIGVVTALVLLTTAAVASALGWWTPATRLDVFTWGLASWFAGVIWGAWINGRPLPRRVLLRWAGEE